MTRFSLDTELKADETFYQTPKFKEKEEGFSWSRFRSPDPDDDDDDFTSDGQMKAKEPPHPVGFSFHLTSPSPAKREMEAWLLCHRTPKTTPMRKIPTTTTTTTTTTSNNKLLSPILLKHHFKVTSRYSMQEEEEKKEQQQRDKDVDRIEALIRAISVVDTAPTPQQQPVEKNYKSSSLYTLALAAQEEEKRAMKNYQKIRSEFRKRAKEQANDLARLIQKEDKAAATIIEQEKVLIEKKNKEAAQLLAKQQQQQQQQQQQRKREEEQQALAEAKKEEQKQQEEKEQAEAKNSQASPKLDSPSALVLSKATTLKEIEKEDYVIEAKKSVDMLHHVRHNLVQPFDQDKSVSKRRLQYKKYAKGRLNTLAHDVDKIQQVTNLFKEVCEQSVTDDSQQKTQGLLYFLDLLCSNVLVRVQADVFNGTKGDGFPMAACLSQLAAHQKELKPLLEAHFYSCCPIAIPELPNMDNDGQSFEQKLGMREGETFDRFLARTEGMISIMGNIMASVPKENACFGGHEGVLIYLKRFLNLLPESTDTLPLLTAPVLVSFLTATGHLLACTKSEEFSSILKTIQTSVLPRCDTSTIGQPSTTRLKKVLNEGFDFFRNNSPQGSIELLYYNGTNAAIPTSSNKTFTSNNPFGMKSEATSNNNLPFGNTNNNNSNNISSNKLSPFGNSNSSFAPNNFSMSTSMDMKGNNTSMNTSSTPFGNTNNPTSSFGNTTAATFGNNNNVTSTTPFANGNASTSSNPFGIHNSSTSNNNTPFGSSFGTNNNSSNKNSMNPFGTSFGNTVNNSNNTTMSLTDNNNDNAMMSTSTTPTPFGENQFGLGSFSNNTFSNNNSTPFSGAFNNATNSSSNNSFGNKTRGQNQPFGTPTPFGNPTNPAAAPTPFGPAITNNNNTQNPFGSSSMNTTNTFSNNNNAFGNNNNNQNQSFGVNNNKSFTGDSSKKGPPCRFFAQGRCRNGANCRFSHEMQSTDNNNNAFSSKNTFGGNKSFGGNSNNPFGGPRR